MHDGPMTVDWTRQLCEQFDLQWNLAHGPALNPSLTDEEYLWEPVPGCWSIRPTGPGGRGEIEQAPQPARAAWPRCGEGASSPRARARATVSVRRCVPSLAYRCRRWVLTVLCETYSSAAISGPVRLVGR